MADHKIGESVPKSCTGNDETTKEERDKLKSISAPSEPAQEPQNNLKVDTVPRSQYEGVLDRLGTLERRMQKVAKSIDWDSDDDDQYSDSVPGPWIGAAMLHDIRFMIRTARSNRKAWKEQMTANAAAEQISKDEKKIRDNILGGQSQNAVQMVFDGTKARPTYLDWISFRVEIEADSVPLLEPISVLMEEPNVFRKSNHEKAIDISQYTDNDRVPQDPTSRYFPERIRINSWLLIDALNEAVKEETEHFVGTQLNGTIFLRPFKFLVHYEPQLRAYSEELRGRIHAYTEANPSVLSRVDRSRQKEDRETTAENPSVDLSSSRESSEGDIVAESNRMNDDADSQIWGQSENGSDSKGGILEDSTTLLHLECLLEFYDTIIKPRTDAVESSDDHQISFDDLWNLFKPGDIVLEQGEKQAYRLIQVITPQHSAISPWHRWLSSQGNFADLVDESENDPLRLECVFLDFDGVQFGPVSKSFKIPRYEGRKPIKSFPVYGLRFSTNTDIRQQLVARGMVLLDVATYKSVLHRSSIGLQRGNR